MAQINLGRVKGDTGAQGPQGIQGIQGLQGEAGYTPVKGTDYFTAQDITAIETDLQGYIDEKIGEVENGSY